MHSQVFEAVSVWPNKHYVQKVAVPSHVEQLGSQGRQDPADLKYPASQTEQTVFPALILHSLHPIWIEEQDKHTP